MHPPLITLHNLDCLPAMREMVDNQFELAIVDVPYGINVNTSMGRRKGDTKSSYHKFAGGDKDSPSLEYFDELLRVSIHQIVWGANHFISKLPFDSSCWIVWNKLFSNEVSFASTELAWTNFDKVVSLIELSPNHPDRIHPTQKPVALYKWLLRNYATEGDTILDTHLGSGSIAIACHDYGFNLTGYELDADYYAAAVKRLDDHRSQMKLDL